MSILSFIKGLFTKKTVDSIIADITAKVEHLHVVAAAHAEAEKLHQEEIAKRKQLAEFASAEALRAKTIAGKLKALVS